MTDESSESGRSDRNVQDADGDSVWVIFLAPAMDVRPGFLHLSLLVFQSFSYQGHRSRLALAALTQAPPLPPPPPLPPSLLPICGDSWSSSPSSAPPLTMPEPPLATFASFAAAIIVQSEAQNGI